MASKADLNQVSSVIYDTKTEGLSEKSKTPSNVQMQIENSSRVPEDSLDSEDSVIQFELLDDESDNGMHRTNFIEPRVVQSGMQKIYAYVSGVFTKTQKSQKKEIASDIDEPTAKTNIETFKKHVAEAMDSNFEDPFLKKTILGTEEEPKATQDSWNEDKKEITLYPDPIPPIPGEKKRLPVVISKQVIKDMERPGFRLEIEGEVYENPVNKKTTQELVQENTNFINQFQIDSKTEENQKKTVTINGKKNEIDSNKLVEFVGKKYTYETARELTEKYGENAAQLILFGFLQGHFVREAALYFKITERLGNEYTLQEIEKPLEKRLNYVVKVEVKRNPFGQIRKFRFKFTANTQFVQKGHDESEIETALKFQFHVYNRFIRYQVANYSVDELYLLSK